MQCEFAHGNSHGVICITHINPFAFAHNCACACVQVITSVTDMINEQWCSCCRNSFTCILTFIGVCMSTSELCRHYKNQINTHVLKKILGWDWDSDRHLFLCMLHCFHLWICTDCHILHFPPCLFFHFQLNYQKVACRITKTRLHQATAVYDTCKGAFLWICIKMEACLQFLEECMFTSFCCKNCSTETSAWIYLQLLLFEPKKYIKPEMCVCVCEREKQKHRKTWIMLSLGMGFN